MMRVRKSATLFFAVVGLLLWSGCQTAPRPKPKLAAPTSLLSVRYFTGTALSGAVPTTAPVATPSGSLNVTIDWIALEDRPATTYPPVGSRAVFFSSTGGGDAVLPAAELTRDATITPLDSPGPFVTELHDRQPGRVRLFGFLRAALPPGVTADFAAPDPTPVQDPITAASVHRGVDILVSRPARDGEPLQLSLVIRDMVTPRHGIPGLVAETAVFQLPSDQSRTGLVIPFTFTDTETKAVAVYVSVSGGSDDPAHVAATAECLKQLAADSPTTRPSPATGQTDAWAAVKAAVQSLAPVAGRRSSLAFLADQTHAPLCEDLAMEADDDVLAKLVQNIQAKMTAAAREQPDADVGWFLDRAALELLVKLSDDDSNGKYKMPAELTAILAVHTGEVGRHASSLDDVLRGLGSRAELDTRLSAGNLIFLEDSSPASRVRAFDWLDARHQAPAGYDPLGPGKARREALARAAGAS
jgi:hypothetical protein